MGDLGPDVCTSHSSEISHLQFPAEDSRTKLKETLLPKTKYEDIHGDRNSRSWWGVTLLRKVVAETIASFLVVFMICTVKTNAQNSGALQGLEVALVGGLSVMVIIFSIGHVSGSHINPAVTISYAAIRHFPLKLVPFYLSAHLLGSILAALLLEVIFSPMKNIGVATRPGSPFHAVLAEGVAGFLLLFVASAVSTDTRAIGQFAGIAVGAVITIDILFAAPISGGGINPARALGPAIVAGNYEDVWIYIIGPISGALMGAFTYRLLRAKEGGAERKDTIARSRLLFPKHPNTG